MRPIGFINAFYDFFMGKKNATLNKWRQKYSKLKEEV